MTEKDVKEKYRIVIDSSALRYLDKLDDYKYNQIIQSIFGLEENPRLPGCVKLKTEHGYRIRWSQYRVLYTIDDKKKLVNIYKISDRKDIYKKK